MLQELFFSFCSDIMRPFKKHAVDSFLVLVLGSISTRQESGIANHMAQDSAWYNLYIGGELLL